MAKLPATPYSRGANSPQAESAPTVGNSHLIAASAMSPIMALAIPRCIGLGGQRWQRSRSDWTLNLQTLHVPPIRSARAFSPASRETGLAGWGGAVIWHLGQKPCLLSKLIEYCLHFAQVPCINSRAILNCLSRSRDVPLIPMHPVGKYNIRRIFRPYLISRVSNGQTVGILPEWVYHWGNSPQGIEMRVIRIAEVEAVPIDTATAAPGWTGGAHNNRCCPTAPAKTSAAA